MADFWRVLRCIAEEYLKARPFGQKGVESLLIMAYHLDVNDNGLSLDASAPGDLPPAVHLITKDFTMSQFTCKRTPLTLALMLAFGAPLAVHAQTTTGRMAADPDSVPTGVVSASALGVVHDDMITPVTSLGGAELDGCQDVPRRRKLLKNRNPAVTDEDVAVG